jgi:7-cyano-7-deazaguanine synthase in queuosine biosynthesis
LLVEVLNFLSSDRFSFTFVPLERDRAGQQSYFEFGDLKSWPFHSPDRVLMFSGGLDSLAGAVEAATEGRRLVLVSHRPVSTLDARQKRLFREMQQRFTDQLIRIPVWINKADSLGREPTQRTRSFLYSALGTLVAQSVQAGGVRFYENGIVSLNLPVAEEVLRARASRTTHPVALHLLIALCTAVTDRNFAVDNPYLFKTRTEVVASLAMHGAAHLIAHTCSCSHSMFQTKTQRLCGRCSQCIDRRFATVAAGLLGEDPEKDYVADVFVGTRQDALERAIAVDYTRHAIELARRAESELAAIFGAEISRAVRYEAKRGEAAQRLVSMHKRHGEAVVTVLEQKVRENSSKVVSGTLDRTSLLGMVVGQPGWHHPGQALAIPASDERAETGGSPRSSPAVQSQSSAIARVEASVENLHVKLDAALAGKIQKKKKQKPRKRDTIIFAAILKELKGTKYCSVPDDHRVQPKWEHATASTYPRGYLAGNPWRKKIQDEKTRAKQRMNSFADSELAEVFTFYLPNEFEALVRSLHSRNSHTTSKNSIAAEQHKY